MGTVLVHSAFLATYISRLLQVAASVQVCDAAAGRTLKYKDVPQEKDPRRDDNGGESLLNTKWPSEGSIQFRNVSVKYNKEGGAYALRNINLEIKHAQKVNKLRVL